MKLQMEMSVAIANRIYEILDARGMSQKDFAKLMGKTETEVSRWLSGTHNFTMATICKISAALDAEVVKVADYKLECYQHYTKRIVNVRQANIHGETIVAKPRI